MKRILIVTCSYDHTVDYIIKKYSAISEFYRVNIDRFSDYIISISGQDWSISHNGDKIQRNQIQSIYYRKPAFPDTNGYEKQYRTLICNDILALIDGLVNSFSGIVLTKPYILRKVENKVFQLIYARSNNINTPESFIGNNETFKSIDIPRIIKPLSTGKIISENGIEIIQTNIMHENDEYDDIGLTPIYVQKYISKEFEVRITVVENEIYAVKIISDNQVDWRKSKNNRYEIITIPSKIKKEILQMMNDFTINFGAFDYIVDKNGDWVFLELNPNGQWQWLEQELNLSISKSIINLLTGE